MPGADPDKPSTGDDLASSAAGILARERDRERDLPHDLFVDEAGAARLLGVSRNHVVACISRGELAGVVRLGRTVRIFVPALLMQGMGTDLAGLARDLKLHDLASVVAFLSGELGTALAAGPKRGQSRSRT
jgi:excisionase family DNA binding protein